MEGLQPADILIHALSIVVLFILLRLILWRPVSQYLAQRAQRVKDELDDAARAKAEAEAAKSEYESGIGDLEERGREIMRDSQVRAGEQAKEITDNAQAQADKMLAEARERIDSERREAVAAARREIAQLATEMASKILRREVSAADSVSAARDFFEEKAQQ
ncbi:MAG: F0F1 ATP synthase subunit B [Oscillospiraceae bacterium]|jgi:F-type H+-transporting ATPase subunit b|nr:F0F1 ATP synthase subunit B [Oscillospiraceae bacterium]